MNKKLLENLISKEIAKFDPVGLLSIGAPKKEYKPEVEKIMAKIHLCKNATDCEDLIYKTFVKMFDKKLAGSREKYQILGSRIFNGLKTNAT